MLKDNIGILGDGLLGTALRDRTSWGGISRKTDGYDITSDVSTWDRYFYEIYHGVIVIKRFDIIVNCIAHTDTYSLDRDTHWEVNYEAVIKLTDYCKNNGIKLVHISTDYVYSNSTPNSSESEVPVHCGNWYGYTKLLGDAYVQRFPEFLLIRATHKPNPYPYDNAWTNQIGNFDSVDVIADKVIKLVMNDATGVYNVGTEVKSMYDLAKRTNPDVTISNKLYDVTTPENVTMNVSKLKTFLSDKE